MHVRMAENDKQRKAPRSYYAVIIIIIVFR